MSNHKIGLLTTSFSGYISICFGSPVLSVAPVRTFPVIVDYSSVKRNYWFCTILVRL